RLRQSSQVFQRMKARLIRELDPWPADERNLIDERGIKAELIGEIRLGSQLIGLLLRRLAAWRVEISIDTRERAVDLVLSRDPIDLRQRRQAGVPNRLRVRAAEPVDQRLQ